MKQEYKFGDENLNNLDFYKKGGKVKRKKKYSQKQTQKQSINVVINNSKSTRRPSTKKEAAPPLRRQTYNHQGYVVMPSIQDNSSSLNKIIEAMSNKKTDNVIEPVKTKTLTEIDKQSLMEKANKLYEDRIRLSQSKVANEKKESSEKPLKLSPRRPDVEEDEEDEEEVKPTPSKTPTKTPMTSPPVKKEKEEKEKNQYDDVIKTLDEQLGQNKTPNKEQKYEIIRRVYKIKYPSYFKSGKGISLKSGAGEKLCAFLGIVDIDHESGTREWWESVYDETAKLSNKK